MQLKSTKRTLAFQALKTKLHTWAKDLKRSVSFPFPQALGKLKLLPTCCNSCLGCLVTPFLGRVCSHTINMRHTRVGGKPPSSSTKNRQQSHICVPVSETQGQQWPGRGLADTPGAIGLFPWSVHDHGAQSPSLAISREERGVGVEDSSVTSGVSHGWARVLPNLPCFPRTTQ